MVWMAGLLAACVAAPSPTPSPMEAALAQLLARPELAGGRIGVCVVGSSGEVLAAANADRGFATASNMKLISAAVALATLGGEHRVPTELWMRGPVSAGVLHGELMLRGHGDPSFGTGAAGKAAFKAMASALREAGVQRVVGRVVGDDSWLGREHLGLGWQWDYLDEDYAAPFGGLCCGGNVVTVTVRPGLSEPVVEVQPSVLPAPRVQVQQVEAGGSTRLTTRRALGSDAIEVTGTIAKDARPQSVQVTVRDPAAFAVAVLTSELRQLGIAIEERADVVAEGEPRLVVTHSSPPLAQLVQPLLLNSNNLYAEQVARLAARTALGDGSTVNVERHAKATLAQLGVDTTGMVIADGSGLSRRNLVQPRQLTALLLAVRGAPFREAFVQALPVAGESGTLRSRFRDGHGKGHVSAKTGFISRVVCLSGYLDGPDPVDDPLIFSIMVNDFTCSEEAAKAAVDAFVNQLAAALGCVRSSERDRESELKPVDR